MFYLLVIERIFCLLFVNDIESLVFKQILDSANGSQKVSCLVWQIDHLVVLALSHLLHHRDILLRQEIVGRVGALSHRLGNLLDGDGLCLSLADASRSLTLGVEDGLLLGSLRLVYDGSLLALLD